MEGLALPPGSSVQVVTAQERPDLWERANDQFVGIWPEYNLHGNYSGDYFGQLVPQHSRLQLLLHDVAADRVVGRGRTIPFRWDGSLDDLPTGIDAVGLRAVSESAAPSALSALAAEVDPSHQGSGLSALLIKTMRAVARLHGFDP